MDSESAVIRPEGPELHETPRHTNQPRRRTLSTRWQVGRLVKVSLEATCGFIRDTTGDLVYFAMDDVVAGPGELRAGARVRYRPAGAGVPRAREVTLV